MPSRSSRCELRRAVAGVLGGLLGCGTPSPASEDATTGEPVPSTDERPARASAGFLADAVGSRADLPAADLGTWPVVGGDLPRRPPLATDLTLPCPGPRGAAVVASFGGRVTAVRSTKITDDRSSSAPAPAYRYAVTVTRDDGLTLQYEGLENLAVRPGVLVERTARLGHLSKDVDSALTLRARKGETPLAPAHLLLAPQPARAPHPGG